jgi:hypothetical protein
VFMGKHRISGSTKYMRIKQEQLAAETKTKHILRKTYQAAKKRAGSGHSPMPVRSSLRMPPGQAPVPLLALRVCDKWSKARAALHALACDNTFSVLALAEQLAARSNAVHAESQRS